MNSVSLVGRLSRDPELRYTETGTAVCNFNMAVRNPFDKDGNADFINCVAWAKTGEVVAEYHSKGYEIGVTGRIRTRHYQDENDNRVYVTEVNVDSVHLISGNSNNGDPEPEPEKEKPKNNRGQSNNRNNNSNRNNNNSRNNRKS